MRIAPALIAILLVVAACSENPASRVADPAALPATAIVAAQPNDVDAEAGRLRNALISEVPGLIADTSESERQWISRTQAAFAASCLTVANPQLVVVVDRAPAVQQMRIVLARPSGSWQSLGGTKISTGQRGRRDYYLTLLGVFLHTDAILDWRAEGTFNAQHIRGLGLKGMRVWDFGWQRAERGWGAPGEQSEIRLLLHATDPDYLERRLGRPAPLQRDCVRIPAAMNRFLDRHGVLDADYERAAKADSRFQALLLSDRTPTPLAGNALIVVDSPQVPLARASVPTHSAASLRTRCGPVSRH
jgi:hypothetical protein